MRVLTAQAPAQVNYHTSAQGNEKERERGTKPKEKAEAVTSVPNFTSINNNNRHILSVAQRWPSCHGNIIIHVACMVIKCYRNGYCC